MREKFLTVLVVPHDERNVRRLRLSYRTLKTLAVVAGILLAATAVAIVTYGRVALRATHAAMLERENEKLSAENEKVDRIAENLERTERAYRQIREMAGLPPDDPPTRTVRAEGADERPALEAFAAAAVAEAGSRPEAGVAPSGWPLTVQGFVTARFGGGDGHPGTDIAVPVNTPVLATAPGTVRRAGNDTVYGNFLVLEHGDGFETMYAHNALLLVERGQRVERGETIAYSGNSGRSSAPHLHYEVRRGGTAVDPSPYLE